MTTIATLWVKLGLDQKGYASGLAGAAAKTKQVGQSMMKTGAMMTAGLTLPIIGAGVAATKAAMDLQESQNAANVVFGESVEIMNKYGDTVAKTAGLSRAEFNQLGAVTGAFLKNVGFDTAKAAEETIKLTERAADMASIFNTDVSQALAAIQSGLKGEFNPLEQFGVKLNAAAIEAKALEMGLVGTTQSTLAYADATSKVIKSTDKLQAGIETLMTSGFEDYEAAGQAAADALKLVRVAERDAGVGSEEFAAAMENLLNVQLEWGNELGPVGGQIVSLAKSYDKVGAALEGTKGDITDTMKAQAALALVMKQTDQFAGDFVNTSDGLANSMRITKAEFTDAAAKLGTQLLPLGLKLLQFVSGLVDKFNALSPAQQKNILIIAGVVAALGPLVSIIGGLVTVIGAIIPIITTVAGLLTFPLIAIIAAVIAVIALLYAAWTNNWGGIQEKFAAFVAWITPIWEAVWGAIVKYFEYIWAQVKTIWEAFSLLFQGDFRGFGEKLREAWDRAWNLIKEIFNAALQWFKSINWGEVGKNILKGIINGVLNLRQWAIQTMINLAKGMVEAFKGFFKIKSDSRVMMKVGQHLAGGLMTGFGQNVELSPVPVLGSMRNLGGQTDGGGKQINIEINVDKLGDNADINYLAQEVARRITSAS